MYMEGKYYTNERSQQIVIALLKAHGIRKIIASPGTTNLTFVGSIQQDSWFEIYSSVDERSAAYMACGLAAETGEPVALTCTGATASRNYMPGLTEAYYRKLPILAITANQGSYIVGHHVAQNIDRSNIPNDIAKLSVNIPFCKDAEDEWNCEIQVNKAILELRRHGGGPVHINLATRYSRDFSVKELPPTRVIRRVCVSDDFPSIPHGRIAIYVGSHKLFTIQETEIIDRFCATYDAVVICDHTSGYYGKYRVSYSLIGVQDQYYSEVRSIDLLIHLGEVSGDYDTGLNIQNVWRVNEDGEIRDTFKKLSYVFEMSELSFFIHYAKEGGNKDAFLKHCKAEYEKCYNQIPVLPFSNIWVAQQLSSQLPPNSVLHLGILNTLRSWNFFKVHSSIRTYCNVGGFGIDGNMSSLIGAALANPDKLYYGILGDLAFFYDMNVLGNRHVGNNVRIMLINNGRGTEFRNYNHPCSQFGCEADAFMAAAGHYGNKSSDLVKQYAESLGYEYLSVADKSEFLQEYPRFLSEDMSKPMLFEVFTDSDDESKALMLMHNIIIDESKVRKDRIKNAVRTVMGEPAVRIIKKIIK